jgi:hypothetical protein
MPKVKSQRGAQALAALRERHRLEQELTGAYFAAEAHLAAAMLRQQRQLAAMVQHLGVAQTVALTGQSPTEVRKARAAHPDVAGAAPSGEGQADTVGLTMDTNPPTPPAIPKDSLQPRQ